FFQAEDGIRDFHVTGVQTCALPIDSSTNIDRPIYWDEDSVKIAAPLKEKLKLLGDLPDKAWKESNEWNESLIQAISAFQERHGIENSGFLNEETLAALNVPIDARIEQIILNMERLRWLPKSLGDQYLLINIPDYQLRIMNKGKAELTMKVIVGKVMTKTPVFSDTM